MIDKIEVKTERDRLRFKEIYEMYTEICRYCFKRDFTLKRRIRCNMPKQYASIVKIYSKFIKLTKVDRNFR